MPSIWYDMDWDDPISTHWGRKPISFDPPTDKEWAQVVKKVDAWDREPTAQEYEDDGVDTALEWSEYLESYGVQAYLQKRYGLGG